MTAPTVRGPPGGERLSRRFFSRAPDVVARAMLGNWLVHGDRAGLVVETEAYFDERDLASHARFGQTERNQVMFGVAGVAYVYLCYGIHHMFNVVADRRGTAGAVLVRALAPPPSAGLTADWARGPGKVARALGLVRAHTGTDLTSAPSLCLARGPRRPKSIATGPRVGVAYAGAWAVRPLRFWVDGDPSVSAARG